MLKRERAWLAVCIMLDVAFFAGRGRTVPGADIADRLGEARRGIEPVLQALARAGLLASTRGPKGGYRLARPARDITLDTVVGAIADPAEETSPAIPGGGLRALVAEPFWAELETGLAASLAGQTLADLLSRAAAAGLRRPAAGPLNFAI